MRIDAFEYVKPKTVTEALAALEAHSGEARVIAGGSDLLVRMKLGISSPRYVIGLKHIAELNYVERNNGSLRIGAATPLSAVERSPVVRELFPALAGAAGSVASLQIRNAATISGNVCLETMCWYYNQSRQWKRSRPPCTKAGGETCYVVNRPDACYAAYRGDTAIALVALGARVRIQSARAERTVPLQELFSGDGIAPLKLAASEMIVEFEIPLPALASGSAYRKVSHRNAVDYPQASVAVALNMKLAPTHHRGPDDGTCVSARIVLGAVASGPVRAIEAERIVEGKQIDDELLAAAAEAAVKAAHPVNNMTFGSPSYRRQMVRLLTAQALAEAADRAGHPHS